MIEAALDMITAMKVKLSQSIFEVLLAIYKVKTGSARSRKSVEKVESAWLNSSLANGTLYGQQPTVLLIRSLLLAKYRDNMEQSHTRPYKSSPKIQSVKIQ